MMEWIAPKTYFIYLFDRIKYCYFLHPPICVKFRTTRGILITSRWCVTARFCVTCNINSPPHILICHGKELFVFEVSTPGERKYFLMLWVVVKLSIQIHFSHSNWTYNKWFNKKYLFSILNIVLQLITSLLEHSCTFQFLQNPLPNPLSHHDVF